MSAQIFWGPGGAGSPSVVSGRFRCSEHTWHRLSLAEAGRAQKHFPEAVRPFSSVGQTENDASRSVGTRGEAQSADLAGCRRVRLGTAALLLVVAMGCSPWLQPRHLVR